MTYRLSRMMYLILGKGWSGLRILFLPITFLLSPWISRCDIHYRAEIGGGLVILHPELGIVISGKARIGSNLTLTGGNCIGGRAGMKDDQLVIGDDVDLGANAVILEPARIGNHVNIGAGAVVVKDAPDNAVLVGIPAKNIAETIF